MIHIETWMDFKGYTVSEKSKPTQSVAYGVISFI